jgi:hypothetical protein
MKEFKYEIVEELGVLSEKNGYTKEVNLISYNEAEPKVDIRTWSVDDDGNKKMGKGITLTKEEAEKLIKILED